MTKSILITTSSFGNCAPRALIVLREKGFQVVNNPYGRKLTEQELFELIIEHKPIGLIAGVEPITRGVMESAGENLKVISRVGVGWDNIDHEAAAELGVKVYRTEGILDQPVAELTLGLILNALRNISMHDRQLRASVWEKRMGTLLHGKTVGIIGFGAIGQKVGELCTAFGAKVIYSDICDKDSNCGVCVPLDQLLSQSDIISIHASGCDRIIGEKEISRCKEGIVFVNTARGGLINEESLLIGLRSGHVGYACLDVFEKEPYDGPLTKFDKVIMTSHIGSYAQEARVRMEEMAVENLLKGLKRQKSEVRGQNSGGSIKRQWTKKANT